MILYDDVLELQAEDYGIRLPAEELPWSVCMNILCNQILEKVRLIPAKFLYLRKKNISEAYFFRVDKVDELQGLLHRLVQCWLKLTKRSFLKSTIYKL